MVSDLLSGKTAKTSIKERGNQAKGLGCPTCITKSSGRKRDKSVTEALQKVKLPAKRKQTGGRIFPPPVHYPGGNYPGYDMIGRGIFSKMKREMEKDCKDWYQRQPEGGPPIWKEA